MAYLNKIVIPPNVGTVTSVNTRIGDIVLGKSDVGLDNADNTSDLDKPISTATQTALDSKLNTNGDNGLQFKITPEGGYAIKLINQTGGVSVKGYAVTPSDTVDNAARLIVVDVPNPIGIVYESGVAVGQPMWVVVSGIAEAYFQNAPTRAYLARGFVTGDTGYVSGQIKSEAVPTSPFATDKHFYELGHILETKGAPGLAKMVLHFN